MTATSFACSICGDPATEICVYCTKDACGNHLCAKCSRCSDCCECSVALEESAPAESEAITTAEAPKDPDGPVEEDIVAEDLADSEEDAAKSDTPPGSASS